MRLLFRIIPIFIAVLAAMFILRGATASASKRRSSMGKGKEKTAKLVKDPVCGTYVTAKGSLAASRDSETYHFCSEACRDKFVA